MPQPSQVFALRRAQRRVLNKQLAITTAANWQILVCDTFSSNLISTLLSQTELHKHCVTLKTLIHTTRGSVPDVPALYIVAPTPDNIAYISRDLASSSALYHSAHVAFTTPISSVLLAAFAAQLPIPSPITSCTDLFSDFISLEQSLFTLNIPQSYVQLKAPENESNLSKLLDQIVSSLFSVLLTLCIVPIIRAQPSGPAEAVAARLDAKLRSNLQLFQNVSHSTRTLSFRRPLLLLQDRDIDLYPLLHHTWTYQALVHDCLDMQLDTIEVHVSQDGENTKKTYKLTKEHDSFWSTHAASPFPSVAEAIEKSLTEYRSDVQNINHKAQADGQSQGPVSTDHLADAVSTLPELSKRKENIDVHTNIATSLLNNINRRSLDTFFELENQIMSESSKLSYGATQEYKATVLELLKGVRETVTGDKRGEGTPADKLRLFLIYYITFGSQLCEKDMSDFLAILRKAGADTSVIEHVAKLKGFRHDQVKEAPATGRAINAARLKGLMTSVVNRGYRSIANVAQNAKQLIVEQGSSFAVARVLQIFMSEQARSRNEDFAHNVLTRYLLFDPKLMPSGNNVMSSDMARSHNGEGSSQSARNTRSTIFSDAIVFVVGGGNYVEYDNCLKGFGSTFSVGQGKNILYGTTELVTAEKFLGQLSKVTKQAAG